MKVSRNWLQTYFDTDIPAMEKLDELFSVHTCEVEDIEEKDGDSVFEAKILPDRAHYLLCHKGIADEISVLTGLSLKDVTTKEVTISSAVGAVSVDIQTDLARRYMARRIEDIEVKESPTWLKERLAAIGQKSINNIVDAGNFVMLDIGQPLHVFDADKVEGSIVVRNAQDGEKITLLTGEEVELTSQDMVIADEQGPLAIAGVKGGKRAEVNTETKNIIIESANFSPSAVRLTSTKYNLRNDSSKRFENEITPELAKVGMEHISALIVEFNPQAAIGAITDVYPQPVIPWQVVVTHEYIEKALGISVTEDFVTKTLIAMHCTITLEQGTYTIVPPVNRLDLIIAADVVDEIGRIVGYEKLTNTMPPAIDNLAKTDKTFYWSERIKNLLAENGFSEAILYSLVKKGDFEIFHPLASDKGALRKNLSVKMEEALITNSRNADLLSLDVIKMFEIGRVFTKQGEETHLILGVKQVKKQKGSDSQKIIAETVAILEKELGVKCAGTSAQGEFGSIYEINLDSMVVELPEAGSVADLGFVKLPANLQYKPFSAFPFIARDIAIFVPKGVSGEELLDVILPEAGELCVNHFLFDVYEKDEETSYAYRLVFQSFEKTLTDEEINVIMERVNTAVEAKGWKVR